MILAHFTEQPFSTYPEDAAKMVYPNDHPARGATETVVLFSNRYYNSVEAARLYHERLEEYRLCEEVGYDAIMTNEHHGGPYCMQNRISMTTLAIAMVTERIKLLQAGNPLPIWDNPVTLAEETAMIDLYSKGRLIAGVVRGGGNEQFMNNINPVHNRERFEEAHELLIKAWTEPGPWRWEGEHYDVRVVNPWVRPLQYPHPRVVVPGVTSPETIVFAAQHGYPYICLASTLEDTKKIWGMYDEEAERVGYTAGPENRGYFMYCHVQKDAEHALRNAENYNWMMGEFLGIGNPVWHAPTGYSSWEGRKQRMARKTTASRMMTIRERIEQGTVFAGNPKQAIKHIRMWLEETRPSILCLFSTDGKMSHEDSMSCIRTMGEEVLPAVREIAKELGIEDPYEANAPVSFQTGLPSIVPSSTTYDPVTGFAPVGVQVPVLR